MTTNAQWNAWYERNKVLVQRKRKAKAQQTPEGYLKYVWKLYRDRLIATGGFMPIPKKVWVETLKDDPIFEPMFASYQASGYDKRLRPCIRKANTGDTWILGKLVITPYSKIKQNGSCEEVPKPAKKVTW